jgi:hypothetical protein
MLPHILQVCHTQGQHQPDFLHSKKYAKLVMHMHHITKQYVACILEAKKQYLWNQGQAQT